jgi:hypothetical protein
MSYTIKDNQLTEVRGVNLRITEMRPTTKSMFSESTRKRLNGRWRVHDMDNHVLGDIDPHTLGLDLVLFVPLPNVAKEGIGAEFLLEIATAMVIIINELRRRPR